MSFVHLRVHSEYSFLRGACRLENLVLRAAELGMPAVALTDYGVLHGAARFCKIAGRHGIKPILGAEFRLPSGLPLVLLVHTREGWHNLLSLVNGAQLALPARETLGYEHLERCAGGLTAVLHTSGDGCNLPEQACLQAAAADLRSLRPVFGKELYLGLEDAGLSGTVRRNRLLAALALAEGVPLLASHNVHYVRPEDDVVYRMVNCIRTGRPLAGSRQSFLPGSRELVAPQEMYSRFPSFGGAYENALSIADRCDFTLDGVELHLPDFTPPWGFSPEVYLRCLCAEGLGRESLPRVDALARLEHELAIIEKKGLASYFLIVHDLVSFARQSRIAIGPGRGSAGGSLVAYLLGITRVDPLANGLYFERFLSEDRSGFPDIDIDVCQRRRDELLSYLRSAYGTGRVAQVSTFSTLGARAAVREVGKVLDLPGDKVAAVAEALPHYGGISAAVSQYPEFSSPLMRGEPQKAVLSGARLLEGLCRHLSTHASGVIIGAGDLAEIMPLCRGAAGEVLTQWDKDDVEERGFLKIDVLGSRNLTVIHDTLVSVGQRRGEAPEVEDIPLDDGSTFTALRRGDTLGCFQLESTGMRRVLRRLSPLVIDDLVHLLSLYRPGPWESGMVQAFIDRRHGRKEVEYVHPALEPLLSDTYGVVLYQEQVMRIAHEIGGYTPGEADGLRREMTRRSPALAGWHRKKFVAGAGPKGLNEHEAGAVFDHLCSFAGYGFNKAHSAAYALVSYWTAYLKTHYPVEFYAALLSSGSGYYGPAVYIQEARARGVPVLPPHVNKSGLAFKAEGQAIRSSLSLVRDLGGRGVSAILAARRAGPFASLSDFCCRLGRGTLRRQALSNLVKVGGFEGLGLNRRQSLAVLDDVLKWSARLPGQLSLIEFLPEETVAEAPALPEYTMAEKVSAELENLGMALTAHPLACFAAKLQGLERTPLGCLPDLAPEQEVSAAGVVISRSRRRLKRGGVMLTLLLCDESGYGEVILYPATYRRLLYRLDSWGFAVTGRTTADGDVIIAEDLQPLGKMQPS